MDDYVIETINIDDRGYIQFKKDTKTIAEAIYSRNIVKIVNVAREYGNQGYCGKILREVERQIRKNGYQECKVIVEPIHEIDGNKVREFYLRQGWKPLPWYKQIIYSENYLCKSLTDNPVEDDWTFTWIS